MIHGMKLSFPFSLIAKWNLLSNYLCWYELLSMETIFNQYQGVKSFLIFNSRKCFYGFPFCVLLIFHTFADVFLSFF